MPTTRTPNTTPGPSAYEAIRLAEVTRWRGMRSCRAYALQAALAYHEIATAVDYDCRGLTGDQALRTIPANIATPAALSLTMSRVWVGRQHLSSGAINQRLNALVGCGVNVTGFRQRKDRTLRWWLTPELEARLTQWLIETGEKDMADYIMFTTHAGLRVEENLRLTAADFTRDRQLDRVLVTVPGTKTAGSQATIPLHRTAVEVYSRRLPHDAAPTARLFAFNYQWLNVRWDRCRAFMGYSVQDRGVTLKALRRSFARRATYEWGMPVQVLREFLRHSDIETTMGYLRLVGASNTRDLAKWLD